MSASLRQLAAKLFTTPKPVVPVPTGRWRGVTVYIAAILAGAWVFTFLMRRYLGLGTTYDLFVNVQLATSWLQGEFLHDNLFGNYLAVHTYFLNPLLAVFAYPFGAPGLLFAGGLAVALGLVAMVKILRLFDVPLGLAVVGALIATLMPLSLQVYQVDFYGFQVELLIPCLALWLAYFLLQRRWTGSILLGLALQAVKEDAVFILVPVAVTVICEDFLRSWASREHCDWRKAWNVPAVTIGLASVLITPLLLYLVQSQPVVDNANLNGFQKVHALDQSAITGIGSLAAYLSANLWTWLQSDTVAKWLVAVTAGTFGLIIMRPHLLAAAVLGTLTAWFVQGDLMWAPRFAPVLAFIQLAGCLGFASVWRLSGDQARSGRSAGWVRGSLAAGAVLALGLVLARQHNLAPRTSEIYRLEPSLAISPADRRKADELFAHYRRAAPAEDPVLASEYLYRYAHDRNFFWYHRLQGRPKPVWILWDRMDVSLSALWAILRSNGLGDVDDYKRFAQDGRFMIFRRKSDKEVAQESQAAPLPILGEPHGMVRMKVKIAEGRAGLTEPLLSIGPAGNGALFFFRYLDDKHLVLGMENMGEGTYTSAPIPFDTDKTHELELFCGSLLAPGEASDPPASVTWRLAQQNLVSARFDGREVLRSLAPQHSVPPDQVVAGVNTVKAAGAGQKFLGTISEVVREGAPTEFAGAAVTDQYGPVRLVVQLPAAAAGVPEPLIVLGTTGDATLGYVRVLPDNKIKVGLEFWGVGAFESEAIEVRERSRVEIIYAFPGLFPPLGQGNWGNEPKKTRAQKHSRFKAIVNGALVLDRELPVPVPRSKQMDFGSNRAGGSWVGPAFTGRILQVTRVPSMASEASALQPPSQVSLGGKAPETGPSDPATHKKLKSL